MGAPGGWRRRGRRLERSGRLAGVIRLAGGPGGEAGRNQRLREGKELGAAGEQAGRWREAQARLRTGLRGWL